jgi:hypothetical protein
MSTKFLVLRDIVLENLGLDLLLDSMMTRKLVYASSIRMACNLNQTRSYTTRRSDYRGNQVSTSWSVAGLHVLSRPNRYRIISRSPLQFSKTT